MEIITSCVFSNPVRYDGSVPTLPTHTFYFKDSVCDVTETGTETGTTTVSLGYNPSVGINSPEDISLYGSLTAGDIFIGFMLLMQLFIILLYILIRAIFGVTTGRKYIQYSNGDVPIVKEL